MLRRHKSKCARKYTPRFVDIHEQLLRQVQKRQLCARAQTQMAQKEHKESTARSHGGHGKSRVLDNRKAKLAKAKWKYNFCDQFLRLLANATTETINQAWRCWRCKAAIMHKYQAVTFGWVAYFTQCEHAPRKPPSVYLAKRLAKHGCTWAATRTSCFAHSH